MDYESLSSELLRALRGKRSQTAFSKRLGYRSNVAYAWESGRAWPTALDFFGILERSGRKLEPALAAFFRVPAGDSVQADLKSARGIAAFLDDLRGQTAVVDLARATKRSRFAVARWLKGDAEPRLPDFLRLLECASLRLLDFLACFIDPSTLPSVAKIWRELEIARRAAYEMPWSHAVLRVIELPVYRKLPAHQPGLIAERLGISREEEERCVALLLETGQLKKQGKRLIPGAALTVDTRGDAARSRDGQGLLDARFARSHRSRRGRHVLVQSIFGLARGSRAHSRAASRLLPRAAPDRGRLRARRMHRAGQRAFARARRTA